MSDDEKWIHYDKPHHLIVRDALRIWEFPFEDVEPSLAATEIPDLTVGPQPVGCFRFANGTTQNWTLNQLYGWSQHPTTKKWTRTQLSAFTQYQPWTGFVLSNHHNLALSAYVNKLFVLDPSIAFCDIFFESPDLSTNTQWANVKGYTLDVHRMFFSHWLMINNYSNQPPFYTVQLQMYVIKKEKSTGKTLIDTTTGNPYFLWAECNPTTQQQIEHPVDYNQNYHLSMQPTQLTTPSKTLDITLYKVRIRCRMLGYLGAGQGELAGGGHWLIGNVCPIT
jgi:hypothetical protein